jgi:Domain of unknown function (DUF1823)
MLNLRFLSILFLIGAIEVSSFRYHLRQGSKFIAQMENSKCEPCGDVNCESGTGFEGKLLKNLVDSISSNDLMNENLVKIVNLESSDQECNYLCWKCLGYEYDISSKQFVLSPKVFPKWAKKYPVPPDLIGVTRTYDDPDIDRPVRNASMDLMRSIPRDFKGGVRNLQDAGFKGFKLNELTPNKTRRAQLVNWLIYYREKLYGKTMEQLRAEREAESTTLQEIASLPSEKMFQIKRLDVDEDLDA